MILCLFLKKKERGRAIARKLTIFFYKYYRATLARNVELCMTDVLIQLIEDVRILGPELTELILEQFDKFEKVI